MIKVQTKHIIIMSCPSLYHPTNIVNWVDHQIVRSLELRLPVECLSEYLNIGLLFVCLLPLLLLLLLLRYTPTTHLTTHEAPLLRKQLQQTHWYTLCRLVPIPSPLSRSTSTSTTKSQLVTWTTTSIRSCCHRLDVGLGETDAQVVRLGQLEVVHFN